MKKFFSIIVLVFFVGIALVGCSFDEVTPATSLEETIEFVFFGKDSEQVQEAYGFEFSSDEVYSIINPDATETELALYEACQKAMEDVVEYSTEVVSEDGESAVVKLTVTPLDIVTVLETVTVNSISPDFDELSEEEKHQKITEQYILALEEALPGAEQSFEVSMVNKDGFWIIQDVDSIEELNFLCSKYLTNIGTLLEMLSDESESSDVVEEPEDESDPEVAGPSID